MRSTVEAPTQQRRTTMHARCWMQPQHSQVGIRSVSSGGKGVLLSMNHVALADGRGRALIVGGGIANFTDVAATFKGIIQV